MSKARNRYASPVCGFLLLGWLRSYPLAQPQYQSILTAQQHSQGSLAPRYDASDMEKIRKVLPNYTCTWTLPDPAPRSSLLACKSRYMYEYAGFAWACGRGSNGQRRLKLNLWMGTSHMILSFYLVSLILPLRYPSSIDYLYFSPRKYLYLSEGHAMGPRGIQ